MSILKFILPKVCNNCSHEEEHGEDKNKWNAIIVYNYGDDLEDSIQFNFCPNCESDYVKILKQLPFK